ncbi:unnamed protein product [Discula destructiva]
MIESKPLRVLIVGGGIGGLAAAIALRLRGHVVQVFEKSSLNTELGNAVYCAPNCTAALSHLGVHPGEFGAVLNNGFDFIKVDGTLEERMRVPKEARAQWLAEWYLIARVDLHNALKHRATSPEGPGRPVQIHTASPISSIDCKAATITTSDGKTTHGDLVVGADGIHSRTRASVLGREVPLISTGTSCYRLLLPTADLLADAETAVFADQPGVFVQIASDDRRICMYPCSSGKVMNVAAFVPSKDIGETNKGATSYDQSANKKQLLDHFRGFAPSTQRMLEKAPEDAIKLWGLSDLELLPSLVNEHAVLIGDAAHPFLPHMGQGAAQAIEDGCALGVVMPLGTTVEDVPERLKLWEHLRKGRAQKIVELTRNRAFEKDGLKQTVEEFKAAMDYCISHDAWKHAEEGLRNSK